MIFYFTGTGNTLWAARRLAQATGDTLHSIADEMRKEPQSYTLNDGERLGFCFPTHGWQPPRIVREFIRRSTFCVHADTYVYALTTCGDNMGHAMRILNKELRKRSLRCDATFAVVMPESNVCFSFLHLDSPEKAEQKIARAGERLQHIGELVKARQRGVSELVRGAIPYTYTYVIGGYYNKHLISDQKLWVDTDACTRCGLCERLCPVNDIKGTPPEWLHNGRCTNCLACYHHCPAHAIHWAKMERGQYKMRNEE